MEKREIQNLIKELLEKATLSVTSISITEKDGSSSDPKNIPTTWFSVELNQPHYFISREGEALFALNHLVKKIVESKMIQNNKDGQIPQKNNQIIVDINGFQKKRIENIHAIAHMMAERARYFKSNIEIDPMSAYERRIVHEFLSLAPDLKTESVGEGASRRVVIKYLG